MANPKLNNLKLLERQWLAPVESAQGEGPIEQAFSGLSPAPFINKLWPADSLWAKAVSILGMGGTPAQQRAKVERIILREFELIRAQALRINGVSNYSLRTLQFYSQLHVHFSKKQTSSEISTALNKSCEIVERAAGEILAKKLKSSYEEAVAAIGRILALECPTPANAAAVQMRVHSRSSITGNEDVGQLCQLFNITQEGDKSRLQGLVNSVKEEADFGRLLMSKPKSIANRWELISQRTQETLEQIRELEEGRSAFAHIKAGSKNFFMELLWRQLADRIQDDTILPQVFEKVEESIASGRLPDLSAVLDEIYTAYGSSGFLTSADTIHSAIQKLYRIPGPIFSDPNRSANFLKVIFPGALAEFLERKYQGGAIEMAAPLLPTWLINANRLFGVIGFDGKKSFSQLLRERAQLAFEDFLADNGGDAQDSFSSFFSAITQAIGHYLPDSQVGTEALIQSLVPTYKTPYASFLEIKKKGPGYDVSVYSVGNVAKYYPCDEQGKRCSLLFKDVSYVALESGFIERFLQWGYSSELGLEMPAYDDFYKNLCALGIPYAHSCPIDPRASVQLSHHYALQIIGKSSLEIEEGSFYLDLAVLKLLCKEHEAALLSVEDPLGESLSLKLAAIVSSIRTARMPKGLKTLEPTILEALDFIESRVLKYTFDPAHLTQEALRSGARDIAQAVRNNSGLMGLLLMDQADPMTDLLMERLGLNPAQIKSQGLVEPSWWIRNQHLMLEVLYTCAVVGLFYGIGALAGWTSIGAGSTVYLILNYIAPHLNWKTYLPEPIRGIVDIALRWRYSLVSWFWLRVRDVFRALIWKILEYAPNDKAGRFLKSWEAYLLAANQFLEHGHAVKLDDSLILKPYVHKLGAVHPLRGINSRHDLFLAAQSLSGQELSFWKVSQATCIDWLGFFETAARCANTSESIDWLMNVFRGKIKLRSFIETMPLAIDSEGKELWDNLANALSKEKVQSVLYALAFYPRVYSKFFHTQSRAQFFWELQAIATINHAYIAGFAIQEPAKNELLWTLKREIESIAALVNDDDKIETLSFSPKRNKRLKAIIVHLANLPVKSTWDEIISFLRTLKALPSIGQAAGKEVFKNLESRVGLIDDVAGYTQRLRQMGHAYFGNHASKLIKPTDPVLIAEPILWSFRSFIAQEPEIVAQLTAGINQLEQKYNPRGLINKGIDREFLGFLLLTQVFNPDPQVQEYLHIPAALLSWVKHYCQIISNHPFALWLVGDEDRVNTPPLIYLEGLFKPPLDPYERTAKESYLAKCEQLTGIIVHVRERSSNHQLRAQCIFDLPLQTSTIKELISHISKHGIPSRPTGDVQDLCLDPNRSVASLCSFLTAHPLLCTRSALFREYVVKIFTQASAVERSLAYEAQFPAQIQVMWDTLWRFAPDCPFYQQWLLELGLVLEESFFTDKPNLDLALSNKVFAMLEQIVKEPELGVIRAQVALKALYIVFRPSLAYTSEQKAQALLAYMSLDLEHLVPMSKQRRDSMLNRFQFGPIDSHLDAEFSSLMFQLVSFLYGRQIVSVNQNITRAVTHPIVESIAYDTLAQIELWLSCMNTDELSALFNRMLETRIGTSASYRWTRCLVRQGGDSRWLLTASPWQPSVQLSAQESIEYSYSVAQNKLTNASMASFLADNRQDFLNLEIVANLRIRGQALERKDRNGLKIWSTSDGRFEFEIAYDPNQHSTSTALCLYDGNEKLLYQPQLDRDRSLRALPREYAKEHASVLKPILLKILPQPYAKESYFVFLNEASTKAVVLFPCAKHPYEPYQDYESDFERAHIEFSYDEVHKSWSAKCIILKTIRSATPEGRVLKAVLPLNEMPRALAALKHISEHGWLAEVDTQEGLEEYFRDFSRNKPLKLSHHELGLEFSYSQNRIYETLRFKGYWIDPNQALIANQLPWDSYVLLRNEQNSQVILTKRSASVSSALFKRVLPQLPLCSMLSYLLTSELAPDKVQAMVAGKGKVLSDYTLSSDMSLSSSSFQALVELFIAFCLQGDFLKAEHALRQIEQWQSTRVLEAVDSSALLFLAAQQVEPQMALLRLRLLACMGKQQQISDRKGLESGYEWGYLAIAIAGLADYNSLLSNRESCPIESVLSVRDEILILKAVRKGQSILKKLIRNGYNKRLEKAHTQWAKKHHKGDWVGKILPSDIKNLASDYLFDGLSFEEFLAVFIEYSLYPKRVLARMKNLYQWESLQTAEHLLGPGPSRLHNISELASIGSKAVSSAAKELIEVGFGVMDTIGSALARAPILSFETQGQQGPFSAFVDIGLYLTRPARALCYETHLLCALNNSQPLNGPLPALSYETLVGYFFNYYEYALGLGDTDPDFKRRIQIYQGGWDELSRALLQILQAAVLKIGPRPPSVNELTQWANLQNHREPGVVSFICFLGKQKDTFESLLDRIYQPLTPMASSKFNALFLPTMPTASTATTILSILPAKWVGRTLKGAAAAFQAKKLPHTSSSLTRLCYSLAQKNYWIS